MTSGTAATGDACAGKTNAPSEGFDRAPKAFSVPSDRKPVEDDGENMRMTIYRRR